MKFSLEWLKQHLDTDASAEEIAKKLTAIGLEVEDLSNPAEALAPFRVAKVLTAEKHPQADKLQVLTVDAGTGEEIQIVRASWYLHPRQRHYVEGGRNPRRREPRNDVLVARARAGRGP